MKTKKENLLEILESLKDDWQIASWLKELVLLTNDEKVINASIDIIFFWIQELKNKKYNNIKQKLKSIKKEEKKDKNEAEKFLENNLNFI